MGKTALRKIISALPSRKVFMITDTNCTSRNYHYQSRIKIA